MLQVYINFQFTFDEWVKKSTVQPKAALLFVLGSLDVISKYFLMTGHFIYFFYNIQIELYTLTLGPLIFAVNFFSDVWFFVSKLIFESLSNKTNRAGYRRL